MTRVHGSPRGRAIPSDARIRGSPGGQCGRLATVAAAAVQPLGQSPTVPCLDTHYRNSTPPPKTPCPLGGGVCAPLDCVVTSARRADNAEAGGADCWSRPGSLPRLEGPASRLTLPFPFVSARVTMRLPAVTPLLTRLLLTAALLVQPTWGLSAAWVGDASGCGGQAPATTGCCCRQRAAESACGCRAPQATPTSRGQVGLEDAPSVATSSGRRPTANTTRSAHAEQSADGPRKVTTVPCPCVSPQPIPHESERSRGSTSESQRLPLPIAGIVPAHLSLGSGQRVFPASSFARSLPHFSQRHFGVWRL